MARAFLLLGTNQGDLESNIRKALQNLRTNCIQIVKKSRFSKTKPWGCKNQSDFLNVAMKVETDLEPVELLATCKSIEFRMGRKPNGLRWGPRIIDIDIIFYEDRIINTGELTVPHSQFLNRLFAIELVSEIAPTYVYPGTSRAIQDYLPRPV